MKIKDIFIDTIIPYMSEKEFEWKKSSDTFVFDNKKWKFECVLHFIKRNEVTSISTKFYIVSKEIDAFLKKAKIENLYRTTCGGETKSLYNFFNLTYPHKYHNLIVDETCMDENINLWINDFELVGLPFFKEFANLNKIENLFNSLPKEQSSFININAVNSAIKGIIVNYLVYNDKEIVMELLDRYESQVKDYSSYLFLSLEILKKYINRCSCPVPPHYKCGGTGSATTPTNIPWQK